MKISDLKNQIFTVPNILTYLRILAVPAIMALTLIDSTYTAVGSYNFPIIALVVMVVAAATDLVDGWIARKFNQITDLGKLLDPLADKFMHTMTLVALSIVGFVHWAFVVVIMIKELLMLAGGIVLAKRGRVVQARMVGKVASAIISVAIIMSYFHEFFANMLPAFPLDWIVLTIGVVLTYVAFFSYLKHALSLEKAAKSEKSNESEEVE